MVQFPAIKHPYKPKELGKKNSYLKTAKKQNGFMGFPDNFTEVIVTL